MFNEVFVKQTLIATRPVLIDGTQVNEGDRVDMSTISPRLASLLIGQRKMRPMSEVEAAEKKPAVAIGEQKVMQPPAPAPTKPAVEPVKAPVSNPGPTDTVTSAKKFEPIHKGFGKWHVQAPDGKLVAGPMKQDEAAAEAAKLNGGV